MISSWFRKALPIASIFSFRMLGLFMLIPVFSVMASQLENASPALIGIALGSYGLSQGICQIPFGLLSDYFGRKRILVIGLILFALGSLLGATTHTIYGMIVARIIQGMGAIGSVLIALLADLTAPDERTKSMAVIGLVIGVSFSLAMVLSPIITAHFGLSGIFYFTFFLAIAGLVILFLFIPNPRQEIFHAESETNPKLLRTVLANARLWRLNVGIFIQHFILTATFYAIPILLSQQLSTARLHQQWQFYLPIMLLAFVAMIPLIFLAERGKKMRIIFLLSIAMVGAAQLFLVFFAENLISLFSLMFIYFTAFNVLEASLPSLISKTAPANSRGTAMGIYSTSQFLGIFAGGTLAGAIVQHINLSGIFVANAVICLFWLIYSWPIIIE